MKKKQNLLRNITFSIVIFSIIFVSSIGIFQYNMYLQQKKASNQEHYKNISILLNELYNTVQGLDYDITLYKTSNNEKYLISFQERMNIYEGKENRSSGKYLLDEDGKISFHDLIMNELDQYDTSYQLEMTALLEKVEIVFEEQEQLVGILPAEDLPDLHNNYLVDLMAFNSQLNTFELLIKSNHSDFLSDQNIMIAGIKIAWYSANTFLLVLGLLIIIRTYSLLLKPIRDGHHIVEEVNNGNTLIRWDYPYNNEMADLVRSFNQYLDLSQTSYRLIEEQYRQLKIYGDIGEINYFVFNLRTHSLKVIYCQKFVQMFGLDANEVQYEMDIYKQWIHPQDCERLNNWVSHYDEMDQLDLEYRIQVPSTQEYIYLRVIGQPNGDIIMGVQMDITKIKKTQHLLQQQEEQYRLIVENSTDLIAKFDTSGKLIFASKSFKEIYSKENVIQYINPDWFKEIINPPYSNKNLSSVDTRWGVRWISWNNDAVFEEGQVSSIISVGHDITDIKMINDRLKFESEHDLLTGLLNRRGLLNQMNYLKSANNLAAFFIDINNFKNINDFYGHEIGDNIINKVANELTEFEQFNCIIGRLSGDEFIVLLPNFENTAYFNVIKTKLISNVRKNYRINNNDIYITSSVGYAIYPYDTDDMERLIAYADIAMYEAKIAHHTKCMRFTKNMFSVVNNKVEMANDLRKALDKDEFKIVFQPIVNVQTNQIDSFESLVRWESTKGVIMPKDFLPTALESGFIETLDIMIIRKALKIYHKWQVHHLHESAKIAINVTPSMLLKKDFPKQLDRIAKREAILPRLIIVEISENTFVHNVEDCLKQINKLRQLGFLIALDDFGNEYSSLSILEKVEFDIIKIDMAFTNKLNDETNVEIIKMVQKITKLKHKLMIVEGVETEEQKQKLMELNCDLMQGFYFSKPVRMD